jgi:hypothetical protein
MKKKPLQKAALCAWKYWATKPDHCFFSDRETIKPEPKAHKPADSGVVVGNDARRCSLDEVTPGVFKRAA